MSEGLRRRRCVQCQRPIQARSTTAIFLYFRQSGLEVWLCGAGCEHAYNEGEPAKQTLPLDLVS